MAGYSPYATPVRVLAENLVKRLRYVEKAAIKNDLRAFPGELLDAQRLANEMNVALADLLARARRAKMI